MHGTLISPAKFQGSQHWQKKKINKKIRCTANIQNNRRVIGKQNEIRRMLVPQTTNFWFDY